MRLEDLRRVGSKVDKGSLKPRSCNSLNGPEVVEAVGRAAREHSGNGNGCRVEVEELVGKLKRWRRKVSS